MAVMNLPQHMSPSLNDVICARGKDAKLHPGNQRYRQLLSDKLPQYSQLSTKLEKSLLVSEIVDSIQSQGGDFMKQINGQWVPVDEAVAREKIGQNLRDQLSSKYKSSAKSKRRRRAMQGCATTTEIHALLQSNPVVKASLEEMQATVAKTNAKTKGNDDELVFRVFNTAQRRILEALKKDTFLVQKFNKIYNEAATLSSE
jgi:hypothetical protein